MGKALELVGTSSRKHPDIKEPKSLLESMRIKIEGLASDITGIKALYREQGKSILSRLEGILSDLDKTIQIKEKDLFTEGRSKTTENHYKLGILKGTESLIRRAHALLEEYDKKEEDEEKDIVDEEDEDEDEDEDDWDEEENEDEDEDYGDK